MRSSTIFTAAAAASVAVLRGLPSSCHLGSCNEMDAFLQQGLQHSSC
jgi:hypothetical protein